MYALKFSAFVNCYFSRTKVQFDYNKLKQINYSSDKSKITSVIVKYKFNQLFGVDLNWLPISILVKFVLVETTDLIKGGLKQEVFFIKVIDEYYSPVFLQLIRLYSCALSLLKVLI